MRDLHQTFTVQFIATAKIIILHRRSFKLNANKCYFLLVVLALLFLGLVFYCYLILDDHKSIKLRSGTKKTGRHGIPKIKIKLRHHGPVDELTEEPAKLKYIRKENQIGKLQLICEDDRFGLRFKNEMVQGPCAHLGFKCWDMGIVAWVMTNVVLDD
jgi:hypothetical protein